VPIPPPRPSGRPAKRSAAPLIAVLVLLVVAAGAGFWFVQSSDDEPEAADPIVTSGERDGELDPDGPGAAYTAWFQAIVAGDFEGSCTYLSGSVTARLTASGVPCADAMSVALTAGGLPPNGSTITIEEERIDGDSAKVLFSLDGTVVEEVPATMVREDGAWKVDLFADSDELLPEPSDDALSGACETELRTVKTAVEAYFAQNGEYPPDADALVGEYLRQAPTRAEVGPDGEVTPAGECA
jgi:hypothetical protein